MSQVLFDFSGALQLARDLYAASTLLERVLEERLAVGEAASAAWRGPAGDDFRVQGQIEEDEASRITTALQVEAVDWAQAWSEAMNEQNRRNRQIRVEEISDARGLGEQLVDVVTGDDSTRQVEDLRHIAVPRSPDFTPTGSLQLF